MNQFSYQDFQSNIEKFSQCYADDITSEQYFGYPLNPILTCEENLISGQSNIAYLSMEYGIAPSIYNTFQLKKELNEENKFFTHEVFSNNWLCDYLFKIKTDKMLDIPIYGGGLGVLAGDTMKSVADLGLPVVGVGILWNKGYFKQKFWYKHGQIPQELRWDPRTYPGLIPLNNKIQLKTNDGDLYLRLWKYYIYSHDKKYACPLILLDSNLEENSDHFKKLTDQLYRSDDVSWKIYQRAILGMGAIKALDSLGYTIDRYHLNEGHAAFALVEKYIQLEDKSDLEKLKKKFGYTCHTPVEAGHDRFHIDDIRKIFGDEYVDATLAFGEEDDHPGLINLTLMCMENCQKVNAVAQKHGEITRLQFPKYATKIDAITNGVHLHTWISKSFTELFDSYKDTFKDWRNEPKNLSMVQEIKNDQKFRADMFNAHQINKRALLKTIRHWKLDENVLTIGWARRIAGYKRPALIFHDIERLIDLANNHGPLQIILAGKAHPNDDIGGAHIEEILDHIDKLNDHYDKIKILILENYDTYFGKLLTNSVDVWLNNPLPPFEASGTSGMKAILNGVLQFSTLDGWVVEAADKNIGWIFGYEHQGGEIGTELDLKLDEDSKALYDVLQEIIGEYYKLNTQGKIDYTSPWIDRMINCVDQGAFFNTQRMVQEYQKIMWGATNETIS